MYYTLSSGSSNQNHGQESPVLSSQITLLVFVICIEDMLAGQIGIS